MLTTFGSQLCLKKLAGQAESVDRVSEGVFLGLGTAKDITGITEITSGGYARLEIAPEKWSVLNSREMVNNTRIDFPETTSNYPTLTSYGLFTAGEGGDCFAVGDISPAWAVTAGQVIYTRAGQLSTAFLAGGLTNYWATWLLKWLFGITSPTNPDLYVGFTPDALASKTSISGEVFAGGYSRKALGSLAAVGLDLQDRATTNNVNELLWEITGTLPEDCFQLFLATHATSTALADLAFLDTMDPISPIAGDKIKYLPSELKITLE